MTPPLVIRAMVPEDIEAVVTQERAAFPTVWSPASYLAELANPAALYLVATLEGELVGFIGGCLVGEEVHILTLAVAASHRRQGYGERLLQELLEQAYQRGARRATLEVRAGNQAARALYEKYGFIAVAYIGKYYIDTGEDAVVMWLHPLPAHLAPTTAGQPHYLERS